MGQMAGNLGNRDVMDPGQADWGDLSGGEKGSRLFGGAAKGLLNGYNQYQQQNAMMRQGGGGAPIAPVSQPQVSPQMFMNMQSPFQPQQMQKFQDPLIKRAGGMSGNFYGGSDY